MGEETTFLRALQATPEDAALLQVYADWLEERGDRRAEFLRLRAVLLGMSPEDKQFRSLLAKLRRARAEVSPEWLAALGRAAIENCPLEAEGQVIRASRSFAVGMAGFAMVYFLIGCGIVYFFWRGELAFGPAPFTLALGGVFVCPFMFVAAIRRYVGNIRFVIAADSFREMQGDTVVVQIPFCNVAAVFLDRVGLDRKIAFRLREADDPQPQDLRGPWSNGHVPYGYDYHHCGAGYELEIEEIVAAIGRALAQYQSSGQG
ncbi:MAG TPA: TIGR02996 domain-containing protein [Gemmataceae bacterium]|nr:TIGR02996 domain-containing protein [Gemmataceae bacterium]